MVDLLNIANFYMILFRRINKNISFKLINLLLVVIIFNSCASRKELYVGKTSIEVKGGNFSKIEKSNLKQRLNNQLDDSSKTVTKSIFFFDYINKIKAPAYDSAATNASARNMTASMFHLGYYSAATTCKVDTVGQRVDVDYTVDVGKETLIDTVSYHMLNPDLQQLAVDNKDESRLRKGDPITKVAVLAEVGRLVDTFRNNGYYKFTAAELKVRADTTIAALTNVSDDPFAQLQLLAEAQQQKDSPKIKLAVVLNLPDDTTKLYKYTIGKVYVLPDFTPGDNIFDTSNITQRETKNKNFILRFHERLFKTGFLSRNLTLKPGDVFRQNEYYKTINNFSNAGVWQSVNLQIAEQKDSNKVDLIAELIPANRFGFEAALEASYSTSNSTNNALGGNLFGLSANLSLVNRNIGKEAIKMTHTFRAGVELNNNSKGSNTNRLINSNDFGYSNNILFPRSFNPFQRRRRARYEPGQSFINTSFAYNNRLSLFNLQSVNLNLGNTKVNKKGNKITFRPFNAEFSYLFNESDSFKKILADNQFLRYSYNTAFIVGTSFSYSSTYKNPKHLFSLNRQRDFVFNAEESGLTWGAIPILKKYKRKYIKADAEYKYTVTYPKTALAFRLFAGVGVPIGNDTFRTLPFFKQYFGGGSNSMRGWPVRGIGRGGESLIPYDATKFIFNDRTGDMRLEGNVEYRYDIARIIPNSLTLRGALFVDAGNIWNIKNSKPSGQLDSAQFQFRNLYKQLGVSAGTGFRLDFQYFILRLDLGFRFKRPEISGINDGWEAPSIGFDDFFKKLFAKSERQWRYENFNFTIGISYPF
jgi:outer membrane protein assembly factor BamA